MEAESGRELAAARLVDERTVPHRLSYCKPPPTERERQWNVYHLGSEIERPPLSDRATAGSDKAQRAQELARSAALREAAPCLDLDEISPLSKPGWAPRAGTTREVAMLVTAGGRDCALLAARTEGHYAPVPGLRGTPGDRSAGTRGTPGIRGRPGSAGQVRVRSTSLCGECGECGEASAASSWEIGEVRSRGGTRGTRSLTLSAAVGDAGVVQLDLVSGEIRVPQPSADASAYGVAPAAVAASFGWAILYAIANGLAAQQTESVAGGGGAAASGQPAEGKAKGKGRAKGRAKPKADGGAADLAGYVMLDAAGEHALLN